MTSLLERLDDATHSNWAGGASAVELAFAREMVEEVLRLQSLVRYQPIICGHMIDEVLAYLGMTLANGTFDGIRDDIEAFKTKAYAQDVPQAWLDVIAERRRQMEKLGFTHQQDDGYVYSELPRAAICYIRTAMGHPNIDPPMEWPWSLQHWKPRSPREDLVRAIALGIAEIERIDRQSQSVENPT